MLKSIGLGGGFAFNSPTQAGLLSEALPLHSMRPLQISRKMQSSIIYTQAVDKQCSDRPATD
jgi:hypothetical protein